MTQLLSKDHTILERPFMEFRPFGVDERGEKIHDIAGVIVQSNVEYLESYLSRTQNRGVASAAIHTLCQLLNARIQDPVYHVTPDFLRNTWNSYSYEFVCYLREFCEQLSGDLLFQFNAGREKKVPPLIQILGRPFSMSQIYRMWPHFGQKYVRGVLEFGVGAVTDRSAVLRMKFTEKAFRQFGPYRKRCVEVICESCKGGISGATTQVHGLAPANVRDLSCVVNGDDWCEWEFTWDPSDHSGRWFGQPSQLTQKEQPRGQKKSIRSEKARIQPSEKPRNLPADVLLPVEQTILGRDFMQFRPFGIDEQGEKIRDMSGAIVKLTVEYLHEHVSRGRGEGAANAAVEELCLSLNSRIRDSAYHVTPAFLRNPWNSYSYEFTSFVREFCKVLSGDPFFTLNAAKEKHAPPLVQILCRPFTVPQIYKMVPFLGQKYTKGIESEVMSVTDRSAVVRMKFTARASAQFGPYLRACADLACQSAKGGLIVLPQKIHRLPLATVSDRACMAKGDEYCEWEVTWHPEQRQAPCWPVWGTVMGTLAFAYLRIFYPEVGVLEGFGIALIPPTVAWLHSQRLLDRHAQGREALIQEQVEFLEARHEELREAYLEQEQTRVELRQLNVGLEGKVRERTAELERLNRELQSANKQLQVLDRLKSDFFANVSHELRTPLTLSLGAFRTLLKLSPVAAAKREIQSGLRNTARLLALINELLDLAKFDSGLVELKKQSFDFAALVRAVAANFESADTRRIHFRGVSAPVPLEADLRQMKKVLYNLLSNAFKFSDPGNGQVWLRLYSKGDRIELEVEDNGVGIPRDQQERIFERFTQVEGSGPRYHEGTGIGLALVKEIITLHQGTITVESELGRGSTFTVSVPRGAAAIDRLGAIEDDDPSTIPVIEGSSNEEITSVLSSAGSTDRPLVLVVDDNADMRGYLARLLSNQYRVMLAKDGLEGLEQAQTFRPDLIVTDVMMPRMNGYDLLKAVRKNEALRSIPVIILTARAGTEARVESLETGADDYIAKPFDENEILARVNSLIRIRAQERELVELQKEKLAQFMPAQIAEMVLSDRADTALKSHRAEVTVVFIDLRSFTEFAETAEPEDVIAVLRDYQSEIGRVITDYRGVVERFSGDAIMIFFNDPVPIPNHAEQAVRMAVAMRDRIAQLQEEWNKRGIKLGAGVGIATGYATLGLIGFEKRKDYAAIGVVTNLAARLCGEAQHGQILISEKVMPLVKDHVQTQRIGPLNLKGFHKPVTVYNVTDLRTPPR